MPKDSPNPRPTDAAAILLGYLNFSSGAFDASVWRAANELFAAVEPAAADGTVVEAADAAERVGRGLALRLDALAASEPAFRDSAQARSVLDVVFRRLLPAYRRFHADLLEHQPPGGLERPYFLMAAAQAVLAGDGWGDDDADVAVRRAIATLNDYVGWRPVAVLENGRLSEPYPHERVRPIPLSVAGAGAAHGRYRGLVDDAIGILSRAPEPLLRQADFDLALLEELACDPRAFDFLHPAASRPNYLFGLWDPARIDGQGFYRRMVVQQATLDGILSWPDAALATADDRGLERRAELRRESAAVLAGVMLMASGLSGHGPGAFAAGLPLADLLPRIAGYRDEFYRWLLAELPAAHRARLDEENSRLRQPFGGVRRHINALLAGRRARQVESVSLAATLARLGRAEAAERLAGMVPAASARMAARITSRVVAARALLRRAEGDGARDAAAAEALDHLDAARDLFLRAVDCGAVVDPWNILGLGGQFPLHDPGGESLADPRVDDLVAIAGSILDGYAGVWRQAALEGPPAAAARAAAGLEGLAGWWDQFATTTVSGVPHLSGRETCDSAREVIDSLSLRRRTAPAAPPAGFWREQVASFTSPKAHAQATDCLLHEDDLDGALGLLVHWASLLEGPAIGRSGPVWLGEAERWLARALTDRSAAGRARVRRFVELVEANTAGVADLIGGAASGREPGDQRRPGRARDDAGGDAADDEGLDDETAAGGESVAAAYESMVWRDSTDDGVDGGMLDLDGSGAGTAGGVAAIEEAAEFLAGVFGLMRRAVVSWCAASGPQPPADAASSTPPIPPPAAEVEAVIGWRHSLRRLERTLVRAAAAVAGRDATPSPGMTPTEFDKLRWQRDAAAEQLVEAAVQARETLWMLAAHLHGARSAAAAGRRGAVRRGKGSVGRLFAALFAGDAPATRRLLPQVRGRLEGRLVLYVPLSRGGRPDRVVLARGRERLLERLAACLPRLGLVAEAADIVLLAKALETRRPRGPASVSEFDRVFEAATTALVERIVETAGNGAAPPEVVTERILDGLALLVPRLLDTWTTHARQLRLSVLERVRDDKAFTPLREFVETYGSGLFTQQLLSPPALRGILRGGVRHFLEDLVDRAAGEPDAADPGPPSESPRVQRRPVRLIEDLSSGALPMRVAAARLRLVLESVAENHAEYRDWNSTTTQSDRGECLHVLLEFLRIKAEHDRIAWTLRPVNMAHRVLARRGANAAAEAWRGRMRDETSDTAAGLAERLATLEVQSGVRLASVGDRVRRPFTTALEQDGLESLVEPAVAELFTGEPAGAGDRLETRAESFLGVVGGSGVEVPGWLERLGAAVDRAIERAAAGIAAEPEGRLPEALPWAPLPWETLHAALAK